MDLLSDKIKSFKPEKISALLSDQEDKINQLAQLNDQ